MFKDVFGTEASTRVSLIHGNVLDGESMSLVPGKTTIGIFFYSPYITDGRDCEVEFKLSTSLTYTADADLTYDATSNSYSGELTGLTGETLYEVRLTLGTDTKIKSVVTNTTTLADGTCLQILLVEPFTVMGRMYAVWNGFGVYRSDDFGETFYATNNGLPLCPQFSTAPPLCIDTDGKTLYIILSTCAVYRSIDCGATWEYRGICDTYILNPWGGLQIAGDEFSRTLFASGQKSIAKSVDGGVTWSYSWNFLLADPPLSVIRDAEAWTFSFPCGRVCVDNYDPNKLFFMTSVWGNSFKPPQIGLYYSSNCGTSWIKIHALSHSGGAITLSKDNKFIFCFAISGDAWRYDLTDLENVVEKQLPWGYAGWSTRIVFHPTNPSIMYTTTDMGGIFKSYDYGLNWEYIANTFCGTEIYDLVISDYNPDVLYAQSSRTVEKSIDGGLTWSLLTASTEYDRTATKPYITILRDLHEKRRKALFIHPTNPDRVWVFAEVGRDLLANVANNYNHLYYTSDGGATWAIVETSVQNGGSTAIYFPCHMRSFYRVSDTVFYGAGDLGFYISDDAGETWLQYNIGIFDEASGGKQLLDMCVNPDNTDDIYVLSRTHGVYRTTNAGTLWELRNGTGTNIIERNAYPPSDASDHAYSKSFCMTLCIDPSNPARLVYSRSGIDHVDGVLGAEADHNTYITTDAGLNWLPVVQEKYATMPADQDFPYSLVYEDEKYNHWSDMATDFAISPHDPDIFFSAMNYGLRKLVYNAQSGYWDPCIIYRGVSVTAPLSLGQSIFATDENNIYAVGCDNTYVKTNNGGVTWKTLVTDNIIYEGDSKWSYGMAVEKSGAFLFMGNYFTTYAQSPGYFFKSVDDGNSFRKISIGVPYTPY